VARTPVADLSPLTAWTNLKDFSVFHCADVKDISLAANFAKMENLDIAYTGCSVS